MQQQRDDFQPKSHLQSCPDMLPTINDSEEDRSVERQVSDDPEDKECPEPLLSEDSEQGSNLHLLIIKSE